MAPGTQSDAMPFTRDHAMPNHAFRVMLLSSIGLAFWSARTLMAQERDTTAVTLETMIVTATRTARSVFRIPAPASVVDSATIRRTLPNGIADLFRTTPGLDVTGVGPNQGRLSIRGQRGQRILLLDDGIRMNNARRQQDFGELPALLDLNALERVEVIRGPASVLYGTDAIGGVVNLIRGTPRFGPTTVLHGGATYRYSTAGQQQKPSLGLSGGGGRVSFAASASYRDADNYESPAGAYGRIRLARPTTVQGSGVRDQNYDGRLSYHLGERQRLTATFSRYEAANAGFGYVDNADLGAQGAPTIAITYPDQTVNRFRLGYEALSLGSPIADRLAATAYTSSNVRRFNLDVFVPFGPPGAGVNSLLRNFTDLTTDGFRLEAAKALTGQHLLTYGVDAFRDASENTDTSTTILVGFGPPQTSRSTVPQVPNATFRSIGAFAQADLALTSALNAVLGVRVQQIRASTRTTPGVTDPLVTSTDATAVASMNVGWSVGPGLTLIGGVGRGFRAPNLVERFFNGPTPEGSGFQERNPDLQPETSLNVDVGARGRTGRLTMEGFVFRNTIREGIRIEPTGRTEGPLSVFRNVNVEKIRDQGIEILGDVNLGRGFSVGGTWARLDSDNVLETNNPVGDSYSSKVSGEVRYQDLGGRFWVTYGVRHNGERSDVMLGDNLLGPVFPAFTVHTLRAGATVLRHGPLTHTVTFGIENLTNTLYAEFSNAAFFRPEPKRMLVAAWRTGW